MTKAAKTAQKNASKSKSEDAAPTTGKGKITPEVLAQIARVRTAIQATFGQVAMSMMALPRYKHVPLGDLQALLLEPLIRDRVAIAQLPEDHNPDDGQPSGPVGAMIWAKVSDEVHAKITEQIAAGVYPLRLEPGDWDSGDRVWVLDVIAPTQDMTRRVLANAGKMMKEGGVHIHPVVTRLIGREVLEEMGAKPVSGEE